MKKKSKAMVLVLCALLLLVGAAVGGTVAWLSVRTQDVKNTFTVGNIDLTLDEALTNQGEYKDTNPWIKEDGTTVTNDIELAKRVPTNEYKMVPGTVYPKDPTVTVKKDSEKCYLFVKYTEKNNDAGSGEHYIDYSTNLTSAGGWTALNTATYPGVYYRVVDSSSTQDQKFLLLAPDTDVPAKFPNGGIKIDSSKVDKEYLDAVALGKTAPTDPKAKEAPEIQFSAYAIQYDNIADAAAAWEIVKDMTTP